MSFLQLLHKSKIHPGQHYFIPVFLLLLFCSDAAAFRWFPSTLSVSGASISMPLFGFLQRSTVNDQRQLRTTSSRTFIPDPRRGLLLHLVDVEEPGTCGCQMGMGAGKTPEESRLYCPCLEFRETRTKWLWFSFVFQRHNLIFYDVVARVLLS